jgi:hypothetical protein
VNKKLVVTRDVLFEEEKSWNWSSAEPVQSISDEIFHVVYVDDQVAGSNVAADTGITRSDDDASSPQTEAGTSAGSSRLRPGSPSAERAGETASVAIMTSGPTFQLPFVAMKHHRMTW